MASPHESDALGCLTSFVSGYRENVGVLVLGMNFLSCSSCLFSLLFNRTFFLLSKLYGFVDTLINMYSL